jgi:translation initiation factor 4A
MIYSKSSTVTNRLFLFSAPVPSDVLEMIKKLMKDPIQILVKKEKLTLESIHQFYINVEQE